MVDDGSSCKSSIPLVAGYPAGKENGVVLCVLKDVPDNILNVGQLGCIVREHLGSTSWTQSILHLVLFDSFELCNTHCVQEHAMALKMIWNACTLSIRISSLIFLFQWIPVTKRMKLTHNNHVELLPSQLSTFISSLLEHQCCERAPVHAVHEHLLVRNHAILRCSSSLVSSCSTIILQCPTHHCKLCWKPYRHLLQYP